MNTRGKYSLVMAIFLAEAGFIALHYSSLLRLPGWFWPLAALASFRTARTISYNLVGQPLRGPFTVTEPDGSGAGETVNPRAGSVLGELLACPICTGTHAAMLLVGLAAWSPPLGLAVAAGLGLAGASEIIHWLAEMAEWNAHTSREVCGSYVRARTPLPVPETLERERV